MKKVYMKPTVNVVNMNMTATLLAGSLRGNSNESDLFDDDDLKYGGDTGSQGGGSIWGD